MPLIACPACGHRISSLARFCPKCNHSKNSIKQSIISAGAIIPQEINSAENAPFSHVPFQCNSFCGEELLQSEFKPSLDERILLEGKNFLVIGTFRITDVYVYLTSKRFVLCETSGRNVLFQTGINGIASVAEGRHILSKIIIVTTVSGELLRVKCISHRKWLEVLHELNSSAGASAVMGTDRSEPATGSMKWYFSAAGNNIGPVSEKAMIQLIRNNHTILKDTKVWNSGLSEWKPADETILTIYFSEHNDHGENIRPGMDGSEGSASGLISRVTLKIRKYF